MKVPFNYLPNQFKNNKIYFNEWKKLIKSCEFTLGSYVKKFEKLLNKIKNATRIAVRRLLG